MATMPDIEVKVKTNIRVKHKVLYAESSFYGNNLEAACQAAETDGMVLTGIVPAGGNYVVLIFMGGEEFLRGEDEDGQ